jgi:ABC-2 type transport system permease protein
MAPAEGHPMVMNLNSIKGQFVSSMDTISAQGIRKSVLLTTSRYTRIAPAPVRVSLGIMQLKANPAQYNQRFLKTAVLLEGKFESLFRNRPLADTIKNAPEIGYKEMREDTGRIVVISDGDVIRNDFQNGRPLACGYDKYTGTFFGNRTFIQNIVDYIAGESALMNIRAKEFKS